MQRLEADDAFGERAGLVEADDVDAREPFDGRELLNQHPPARERERGDREGEAREQDEPLGYRGDDAGDDARQRRAPAVVTLELTERQQNRGHRQRPRDEAQDLVDARAELGTHQREPAGLGREPMRVRVRPDARSPGRRPEPATTTLPESTSSPARFTTGSDSPVSSDSSISSPSLVRTHAVGRDLISGPELDQIVEHDLGDRDLATLAVAYDARAAAR